MRYKNIILSAVAWLPTVVFAGNDVESVGDVLAVVLPVGAFSTSWLHNDWSGGVQYASALTTTVGVTVILKESVTKTRPNGDPHSFPSGHTSTAFSTAAFLQNRYGWHYGVPGYAIATFVAWSRVDSDNHYWEDVVAGATIGAVSSFYFTTRFGEKAQTNIKLMPGEVFARISLKW